MRPQGFGQAGPAGLEDLGWNDMGFEPPKPASAPRDTDHDAFGDDVVEHPRSHPTGLTPVSSPVHSQQAEIADRFSADDGDDEIDETAEVYEPEAETEVVRPKKAFALDPVRVDDTPGIAPVDVAEFATPVEAPAPVAKVAPAVAAVVPVAAPRRASKPRSATGAKGKAAFTLRLDPSRHLKLRLACAVNGRSAQQLVTDALDQLLQDMPELDAMAQSAQRKG